MATIDLGKIKQVFRGTYNNATAYVPDDLVVFTDGKLHQLIFVRLHQQETIHHQVEQHMQTGHTLAKGQADPIPSQSTQSGEFLTTNGSALAIGDCRWKVKS